MNDNLTVPAWAETIRVEKRRSKLLVVGEGRVEQPVVFASALKSRSLDLLNQYVPTKQRGDVLPPHIQFARAKSEAEQVAFVEAFGPIMGVVKKNKPYLLVVQELSTLQQEQRVFAAAAKILVEIQSQPRGKTRKNMRRYEESLWESLMDLWNEIDQPIPSFLQISMLESIIKHQGVAYSFEEAQARYMDDEPDPNGILKHVAYTHAFYSAHWNLIELLNRFPVSVSFFAGQPAELPPHMPEGILPMLYFMLRRDYLGTGRRLSTCPFEDCGRLFPVTRAGQKYCSSEHSLLQRQREYWRSKGKKHRAHRRKGLAS